MKLCATALLTVLCGLSVGCRQDPKLDAYLEMMRGEYISLEDDYFALEDDYEQALRDLKAARTKDQHSLDGIDGEFGSLNFNRPTDSIDTPEPLDPRVTHIVVNPFLTTGHDFDQKPGDDGVSIVIEPRNADDQFVPISGPVSIVILDPSADGEDGRLARWEIDAEEAAARLRKSAHRGRGINLKLPWQRQIPKHSNLHVFVRLETEDGRFLEDDTELRVALPGQLSNRWTPKSSAGVVDSSTIKRNRQAAFQQSIAPHDAPAQSFDLNRPASESSEFSGPQEESAPRKKSIRPEWKPYR